MDPPMNLRTLGASGLLVSPICLGTMTFGEPVAEPDAIRLVHGAMDLGINFIDTANVYCFSTISQTRAVRSNAPEASQRSSLDQARS